MTVGERARHLSHDRHEHALGSAAAAPLVAPLPPTGLGEVVSRDDLDNKLEHSALAPTAGERIS